ncbi:MAG: ATP-binding protein [Aeromicrobium sp.]
MTSTGERWYQRVPIRTRVLLISSTAVAVVVAVGGILVILLLRNELIDTAQDLGEDLAEEVAGVAEGGALPVVLSRASEESPAIQVVQSGRVISQTPHNGARRLYPVPQQRPGSLRYYQRDALPIDEDGPFVVVAHGTETPTGAVTVFVAVDVEDVVEVVGIVRNVLGLGIVAVIVVLSGVLWVVIGRTLAPVAAIRTRADSISGTDLHRRVPEPPGHDEIADLARTINAMLGRLEASAERQEAFVADAAHELRTPIASLRARVETALRGGAPADQSLLHDQLVDATRMARLVDQLLLLSQSDSGTIGDEVVPVDLDDTVNDVVMTFGPTAVPITTSQVEPVQVNGQVFLLEVMLTNLLDNALRYARSTIDITLRAQGQHAVLTVDDDGPGIPAGSREDVLKRFVRIDESRARGTGGAGLGLAIVSEIVRLHHGSIDVGESPAGGARLRVVVPLG